MSQTVRWPSPLHSVVHAESVSRLRAAGTGFHEVERVGGAHGAQLQLTAAAVLVPALTARQNRIIVIQRRSVNRYDEVISSEIQVAIPVKSILIPGKFQWHAIVISNRADGGAGLHAMRHSIIQAFVTTAI